MSIWKHKRKEKATEDNSVDTPFKTAVEYLFETKKIGGKIPEPQFIFVEPDYNKEVNKEITENYNLIHEAFEQSYYQSEGSNQFIYLPQLLINGGLKEMINYFRLTNDINEDITEQNITQYFTNYFFKKAGLPIAQLPMVISVSREPVKEGYTKLIGIPLINKKFSVVDILSQIASNSIEESIKLKIAWPEHDDEQYTADNNFYNEAYSLTIDIMKKVERLKDIGFYEMLVDALSGTKQPELSKLLITKDKRIILTDYDNLEIKMESLPKAVYLLFLKYPDGILFKELSNYRTELMSIYLSISNRDNIETIDKSISLATDPYNNSINEKCSRIREAFLKHFKEELAQHYYITGDRGKPKRIELNRELVKYE